MGCPSPAALLVHQARQAEYQELPPDIEDDIASLMRAAGAPRSWLDDYLDSSSDASSDSGEASCSYAEPLRLYVASESAVKASVQQQQQVRPEQQQVMADEAFILRSNSNASGAVHLYYRLSFSTQLAGSFARFSK